MAAYDFRIPNITGNDREQLKQIRSYLYQFIPQLQWALNNLDASSASSNAAQSQSVQRSSVAAATGSSPVNAKDTFNAIKSLIITSADIVEAYYDEINKRLSGLYVAESDFGTYVEATDQRITETSTSVTQAFTNIQTVETTLTSKIGETEDKLTAKIGETDEKVSAVEGNLGSVSASVDGIASTVDGMSSTIGSVSERVDGVSERVDGVSERVDGVADDLESVSGKVDENSENLQEIGKDIDGIGTATILVKASVRTGLLYYLKDGKENMQEGTPVYGVEVGQKVEDKDGNLVFDKFARFTAERLSFYDQNKNEVAYVSNNKLLIHRVEITSGADSVNPAYKIGGYADYVTKGGGVVTKWVGGDG